MCLGQATALEWRGQQGHSKSLLYERKPKSVKAKSYMVFH